jgi:hypothetical protein
MKNKLKKYGPLIAALVTIAVAVFIYSFLRPAPSIGGDQVTPPMLDYPFEYDGSVANTGGDWRTSVVKAWSNEGPLLPAENYITTDISNGGLMWVSCKNGYQVINATSPTSKITTPGNLPSVTGSFIDTYGGTPSTQYIMQVQCKLIE